MKGPFVQGLTVHQSCLLNQRVFSPEREGGPSERRDLQTSQSSHSFMAMPKEKKKKFFLPANSMKLVREKKNIPRADVEAG